MNVTDIERADWPLIRDRAVTLFWRTSVFAATKQDLARIGYRLIEVDCASCAALITALSDGLEWKNQFGYEPWTGNLNALQEGLADAPFGDEMCLALCLEGFHRVVHEDAEYAHSLLDIIEREARNHLVMGRRLLALVQTDDGHYSTGPLGGRAVSWNFAEWFDKSRTLGSV
jgi:hypothetical protein